MDNKTPLAGKRILLLEDDSDARESMAMLLELAGAAVVSTPTAEAALAALQGAEFDAVVTDVAMPGRSGFWLVGHAPRRIRRPDAQARLAASAVRHAEPADAAQLTR